MKISYNWLKQYVNTDWDSEKISDLLTDLGLEVEGTETISICKRRLEGIVVGQVLECEQHPNADRLKLTTIDISEIKNTLKLFVVLQMLQKTKKLPSPLLVQHLYTTEGEAWKIKKVKFVERKVMVCFVLKMNWTW